MMTLISCKCPMIFWSRTVFHSPPRQHLTQYVRWGCKSANWCLMWVLRGWKLAQVDQYQCFTERCFQQNGQAKMDGCLIIVIYSHLLQPQEDIVMGATVCWTLNEDTPYPISIPTHHCPYLLRQCRLLWTQKQNETYNNNLNVDECAEFLSIFSNI